ncbi:MAG: hypothetical protein ACRYG6_07690 [Janthinobacterium lividum]
MGFKFILLLCGILLFWTLISPQYDRALVLSGRTEVISMHLDDAAFGVFQLGHSIYRADPDTPAREGPVELEISTGTTIRLVRSGHGALRMTFAATSPSHEDQACGAGLQAVGSIISENTVSTLCDAATIVLPLAAGDGPLVMGLSGDITVGEEVSQGAGQRPLLLEATASLLVKHNSRLFRWICSGELLESWCDRFVANSVLLSPGDSVRADQQASRSRSPAGLGFIRIDPSEPQSGMLFDLAAPATAFEVQRMQGETFTVRESLFDVIEKSPVVRTLNTALVALGLIWYFLGLTKVGRSSEAGRDAAILLVGALVSFPAVGHAQQAFVRADGVGQALLRSRGDRCYAITPSHVLGAETSVVATAPGRERGEGDLLARIPTAPEPMAFVALRGIPITVCPAFEGTVSLDDVLRAHAGATLQLVRADGSIDRVPLVLGSVEVETLEVRSDTGALEQGMSGGTVLVADQPAGLLVDVTEEGHVGRVARLDRIFERVGPHLSNAPAAAVAHAAAGSVPYDIVRSSAAPVEAANKASGLQGDGPGPWRVPAEGRVELILKLTAPFGGVVLDLAGLPDPPGTVEVLGGRSEHGPWQSLGSFSLEPGDGMQQRLFPPTSLGYVLLRAYAPASRKTLAITRVSFVPK